MATFGHAAIGGLSYTIEDTLFGGYFWCPETGIADSITAWLSVTTVPHKAKCKIYDHLGNTVGETEEKDVPVGNNQEVTFNFSDPKPTLVTDYYYLIIFGEAEEGDIKLKRDATGGLGRYKAATYPTWPDDPVTFSSNTYLCSIYCTYTPTPNIIDMPIQAGSDDGDTSNEDHDYCVFNGADIYIGRTSVDVSMTDFLRWIGINIPQGAIINSAYIRVKSSSTQSGTVVRTDFDGDDEDNCATYSTCANLWGRPRTTATVAWDGIGDWAAGTWYNTIDIKDVVQEIINRLGWASGNALGIFWNGARSDDLARRYYSTYESGSIPRIHIEWEEAPPAAVLAGGSMAAKMIAGKLI